MDSINDSEIQNEIPGFSIVRCDRLLRKGGGVCIYVRNTKSFNVCLTYSNSICDLLIVKLHQPSLIIILTYRPTTEFNDIILKTKTYIMSLPSPLSNIIILGDFNFPNIDCSCSTTRCSMAGPLIDLAGLLFLTHQPSLIIILMYRPLTYPTTEFNDIILKTKSYIMYLPSPLPNIIMLGEFNFPNIDCSCSTTRCPMAGPLKDLAGLLFLTQ